MKKFLCVVLTLLLLVSLAACGNGGGNNAGGNTGGSDKVTGDLHELLKKVTQDTTDPDMMLMENDVDVSNPDSFSWYFFIEPVEGAEAVASEPMMNAIAHCICLLRVPDESKAESIRADIEKNMDVHKWICVEPEKTAVVRRGDLILLVMSTEKAVDTAVANFKAL